MGKEDSREVLSTLTSHLYKNTNRIESMWKSAMRSSLRKSLHAAFSYSKASYKENFYILARQLKAIKRQWQWNWLSSRNIKGGEEKKNFTLVIALLPIISSTLFEARIVINIGTNCRSIFAMHNHLVLQKSKDTRIIYTSLDVYL